MRFTFESLNVFRGGAFFDKILEHLDQEQADILVLQEAWQSDDPQLEARFHTITTIKQHCGYEYADFAPALIDNDLGQRFPSGNAILSRWPLTAHQPIPYDTPFGERLKQTTDSFENTPRNLQHATVHAPGANLEIFNTQGVWDLDGDRASDRRKQMCQSIADATHGLAYVVLAGDFNLKPTNAALAPIDEQLHSVFGTELPTTFNVLQKDLDKFPGYATAVVDLMYVSHDMRVLNHRCPQVDVSDHLPLVATLETL